MGLKLILIIKINNILLVSNKVTLSQLHSCFNPTVPLGGTKK